MKKIIVIILSVVMLIGIMPLSAFAEEKIETLKTPTLQYKIINHDKVKLRWSKVDGADTYYVYKRSDKTGKYFKIHELTSTSATLTKLKPETEYSYTVVAVSEKDEGNVKSKFSNRTVFTTPNEWVYESERIYLEDYSTYREYYRKHYDGTGRERFSVLDYADKNVYAYKDWIFFMDYDKVGRVKKDGTNKEILWDDITRGDGANYSYTTNENNVYFNSSWYWEYYDRELVETDFRKITLDTGEVTILAENCYIYSPVIAYEDYIYFIYVSLFYDETISSYRRIRSSDYPICFYKIKFDGTSEEIVFEWPDELSLDSNMIIYEDEIYIHYDNGTIFKMPLEGGEITQICNLKKDTKMDDFEIVNGYIYVYAFDTYFSFHSSSEEPQIYYRMKTDGTALTESDKPFEWRY